MHGLVAFFALSKFSRILSVVHLRVDERQVEQVLRQQRLHDSFWVLRVQELNDYTNVRCRERFGVLLVQHCLQEFFADAFIDDPVGPNTRNLHSKRLVILILERIIAFQHLLLKVVIINILAWVSLDLDDLLVVCFLQN